MSSNTRRTSHRCTSKLRPGGRLLNHCITRPNNKMSKFPEAFIDRYVFPDGELAGVWPNHHRNPGRRIRRAARGKHSRALRATLRDWCANLREHWDECVDEVGEGTARVWGLYMAGSRLGFERNQVQLHQVLAVKPAAMGDAQVPLRPWWSG